MMLYERRCMKLPPINLWGIDAKLHRLEGGHRNTAFRTRGCGQDFVFKSTRRSPEAMMWLLSVHDLARQSGFIVPQLIESENGHLVENGWTCEPFIHGDPVSIGDLAAIEPQISMFHELSTGVPQRPGFLSSLALLEAMAGGDVDFGAMPPKLVALCRDAWSSVSSGKISIVHGDLNPANLLRCESGRITLLDWDECRQDLIIFDIGQLSNVDATTKRALLAWEVACSWVIEPDHALKAAQHL